MVFPLAGRLLLRLLRRWQTVSFLLLMAVLLWFSFLAADDNPGVPQNRAALQVADKTVRQTVHKKAKSRVGFISQKASPLDLHPALAAETNDIVSPIVRRGPVPNVNDLGEAMPDEENVALEVIDAVKEAPNAQQKALKLDDNAAREEHSVEIDAQKKLQIKHIVVERHAKKKSKPVSEVEEQEESFHQLPEHQKELPEDKYDSYNNWRNLTLSEISKLSVLGRRLFLNEKIGHEQNKIFKIHVWKYMKYIENRLLRRFTSRKVDPFEGCSVSNCKITTKDDEVTEADAVLFHLHRISGPPDSVPRKPHQLWVWMSDESPYNVFMVSKDRKLDHFNGYFNWSMSYRLDSDVPVPYGRTVPLPKDRYKEQIKDYYKLKKLDIVMMGSNCEGINNRYEYIDELQKYVPVDIYGRCGPLKCPGHFSKDCTLIDSYKFYLAFENSNCDDYITEKVWWNALSKGTVPVVMGATKNSYKKLLPPNSFIYAEEFDSPQHLAIYLKHLLDNPDQYNQYHSWRRQYQVLNEHGYFQSPVYHFCRLCEALNYNDRTPSPSANLENYFAKEQHCYPPKWYPV